MAGAVVLGVGAFLALRPSASEKVQAAILDDGSNFMPTAMAIQLEDATCTAEEGDDYECQLDFGETTSKRITFRFRDGALTRPFANGPDTAPESEEDVERVLEADQEELGLPAEVTCTNEGRGVSAEAERVIQEIGGGELSPEDILWSCSMVSTLPNRIGAVVREVQFAADGSAALDRIADENFDP